MVTMDCSFTRSSSRIFLKSVVCVFTLNLLTSRIGNMQGEVIHGQKMELRPSVNRRYRPCKWAVGSCSPRLVSADLELSALVPLIHGVACRLNRSSGRVPPIDILDSHARPQRCTPGARRRRLARRLLAVVDCDIADKATRLSSLLN